MKRTLFFLSGVSVVFTTLAYGHTMYRRTIHVVTEHGEGFGHPFFALHTILAAAAGILSLLGAYFLLTGGRGQNPDWAVDAFC